MVRRPHGISGVHGRCAGSQRLAGHSARQLVPTGKTPHAHIQSGDNTRCHRRRRPKKLEVPIKRLLLGEPMEKVVNRDSMQNPDSLEWFVEFAANRQ